MTAFAAAVQCDFPIGWVELIAAFARLEATYILRFRIGNCQTAISVKVALSSIYIERS